MYVILQTESEHKLPLPARAEKRKRTLEYGLGSSARAAKRLKLESPKTPDKKMGAQLGCHGKVSRPKNTQLVSNVPHEVSHTSAGKGCSFCLVTTIYKLNFVYNRVGIIP